MYQRWKEILKKDFIENKKWVNLNCTLEEYYGNWNGGLVRKEPSDEVINEFAEYNNLDIEIAKKYFNNKCNYEGCKKNVNKNDVIAMNLKFNGRGTNKIYCKKHLKEILNIDNKKWDEYIEQFKSNECELF
jgi:hypothetical protein